MGTRPEATDSGMAGNDGILAWVLYCWLGCPFSEVRVSPIERERTRALHDAHALQTSAGAVFHAQGDGSLIEVLA